MSNKIIATKIDQILSASPEKTGQNEMMKKITANITPKLRSEPRFEYFFFIAWNIANFNIKKRNLKF